MPRSDRGALIACEGFRKRSANAIEFAGFAQHNEHSFVVQSGTKMAEFERARRTSNAASADARRALSADARSPRVRWKAAAGGRYVSRPGVDG